MRPSINEALLFRNRRLFALAVICGWSFMALFSMRQMYSFYLARGETPLTSFIINFNVGIFASWALLTPFIIYVLRRWPPLPFHGARFLLLVLSGLGFALLHAYMASASIAFVFSMWLQPLASFSTTFSNMVGRQMAGVLGNQLYFWALVVIYVFANHVHQFRQNQLRLDSVTHQLESARLQALKMQLHPHFLFNTLNTISAMMHQDVNQADSMLAKLSDFLRFTLRGETKQFVSLSEEFSFLERYLEIQQIRFRDRLKITMTLPEELQQAQVPFLLLQPLVENAIRHGFTQKANRGHLQVLARKQNATLEIQIKDDGPGLKKDLVEGIGWTNTRRRLESLFEARADFYAGNTAEGGCHIRLTLPLNYLPRESKLADE